MNEKDLEEAFAEFDAFLEVLRPFFATPRALVPNPKRLYEMRAAFDAISEIVLEVTPDAEIECEIHEIGDGSAAICIKTSELEVTDIRHFYNAVRFADNFEIYPTFDGKICMDIMFEAVFHCVPL